MRKELKPESAIALNRFGLGARPGELESVNQDPRAWLLGQLQGPPQPSIVIEALPDTASILVDVQRARERQREAKKNGETDKKGLPGSYGRTVRRLYMQQVIARYISAASTDQPFHERLVHFWSNHFAVSTDKQPIPALAGVFEQEAIRPNITGRFSDLVMAVEKHPAMLLYLDNQRSIGPNSQAARRFGKRGSDKKVGLNENLAREILELHTLGVDGGYTQADVTAFAAALTGWSIGGGRGRMSGGTPGEFHFRDAIHEPGAVRILNSTYGQEGVAQAESILAGLARHPSTARHIAEKLARHFVADEPPSKVVNSLTKAYLDSDGDLPTVHAALVNASRAWKRDLEKFKTPDEFMISTFRALKYVPDDAARLFASLEMMGQIPYQPGSPAGWPDTAEQWGGADGLYKRIEWANAVTQEIGGRVNPVQLADAVLGPSLGDHTRTAVSRAESLDQGLALLLVSPEFQRR